MLDIAIVGGGLSGLVLADRMRRAGKSFSLFEARPRLGGRIDSIDCERAGMRVDLGPAWFWPDSQPALSDLVAELDLESFAQHDTGEVFHLKDPDKLPETEAARIHAGARRLAGGMADLTEALAARLDPFAVHLSHELTSVKDCGTHVQLLFLHEGQLEKVTARTVVLAVPPRLLAERVLFEPGLPEGVCEAMDDTPTWMAASAKCVLGYDRAFWRENGLSGNAFVSHGQAVLTEIFDACDASGEKAALGGFLALSPEDRERFSVGLPMLLGNQLAQVFGPDAEAGVLHYRDWAAEASTCSARDRSEPPPRETGGMANPLLRRPLWDGRLHLSGSETAPDGSGYMEGAVQAAERSAAEVLKILSPDIALTGAAGLAESGLSGNPLYLARFAGWVEAQGENAFDLYRKNLTERLSRQERDQLTQQAVLDAFEAVLDDALAMLAGYSFDMTGVPVENGRSALMTDVQSPFRDFLKILMDEVIAFNRTSCALSNFPHEHTLSNEYRQTILRDVASVWREFSLAANRLLLSKADTQGLDQFGGHSFGNHS